MPDPRRALGDAGEALAAAYLRKKGYKILETQHRTPYGEIDLVCLEADEIVFVEVKTRTSKTFGPPESAITPKKLLHMQRAGEYYLQQRKSAFGPWRIDVVAILIVGKQPEIVHFIAVDSAFSS